jgi:arginase
MSSIEIIEVPSEIAASTRGARLGIEAMHTAALHQDSSLFCKQKVTKVSDENQLLCKDTPYACAKRIDGITKMYRRVCKETSRSIQEGYFPLVLAGDHSTAAATIAGLRQANPDDRIGVIWIDAHADLHSPYTSPSGNVHGMPLAAALAIDNTEEQVNSPDETTRQLWQNLKDTGYEGAKFSTDDLFYIGLRDLEQQEQSIIDHHDIPNIRVDELRQNGTDAAVTQALNHLGQCDRIYITFDVDSLDPTISRGTGTPSENGLYADEAASLLRGFMADDKISCLELVEVNPLLDTENIMAETAVSILAQALADRFAI